MRHSLLRTFAVTAACHSTALREETSDHLIGAMETLPSDFLEKESRDLSASLKPRDLGDDERASAPGQAELVVNGATRGLVDPRGDD